MIIFVKKVDKPIRRRHEIYTHSEIIHVSLFVSCLRYFEHKGYGMFAQIRTGLGHLKDVQTPAREILSSLVCFWFTAVHKYD